LLASPKPTFAQVDTEVAALLAKRKALTRLRGFAYGKVDFPMGAWCQGSDFP
jgi:hypothetical protein